MGGLRTRAVATAVVVTAIGLAGGCAAVLEQLEQLDSGSGGPTASDGLREALRVGTGRAVDVLGRTNGFLNSADFRIPVPDELEPIERALSRLGAERLVDDFVTSMNRAAEAAVPLAKPVFVDAIEAMTFSDAVAILRGEQHEATDYLRAQAEPRLRQLFRPIVAERLDAVGATRRLGQLLDRAEQLPFISRPVVSLEDYVTDGALDSLFVALGREEEKIRRDPAARTTELLRKFFGQAGGR